ncbi:MAG: phosphate ABC transporter substrate-binding protein [Candidatus Omnitrophica bacterium]|nr:phosphate ABC transporter substrate-binding protein [Candidatus Omnitrophota bacterium]
MKRILGILTVLASVIGFATVSYAAKIVVEGSTTVLPIAQKAAEVFMQTHTDADISVRGGGSGVGISSLLDGTCSIGDSSRPIKDSELDKARTYGKDIKAHVIAMDGIAVIVNSANSISALTKKQLKDIFTGKVSDWSEVGGTAGKIVAVSRDSSSGTFEAFGTLALGGQKVRSDAVMQASNQAVASTVERTPGAIGYVGLGFLSSSVKALDFAGITPSKEMVLSGKYALGRPLFMYTNGEPQGLVKDFIDFVKSPEGQKIVDQEGFVALK